MIVIPCSHSASLYYGLLDTNSLLTLFLIKSRFLHIHATFDKAGRASIYPGFF